MSRSFLRYSLSLVFTISLLSVVIPIRYGVQYPREAGPLFDDYFKQNSLKTIATEKPQIVMVGDSILKADVDHKKLADKIGKTVYRISEGGSASALWYAIIKHEIIPSPHKPEALIIIFRDTMLTTPGYRVHGSYFKQLDEYATPDDTLIIERAYVNLMNPLEKLAEGFLPPYGLRLHLRETLDHYIRYSGNRFQLGCDSNCTDAAMGTVFGTRNMEQNILGDAIGTAESSLYTSQALDFDRQLERSFLPEIIRLILVHERIFLFPTAAAEPKALQEYKRQMAEYLDAEGVTLLDFSYDPRLPQEYFADVVHMNETGKAVFTQLLAEVLLPIIGAGQ